MKTILLVGLGNPGKKYEKTRHSAGFMFVDYFWEKFSNKFEFSDWKMEKKLKSEISIGKRDRDRIILLKPQTYMNLSGDAVKKAVKFYKIHLKIPSQDTILSGLIVVHDEIDLPLGKYKIQSGVSSAGHNGVQNIIDQLGTKEFTRIRIGIDNREKALIDTEKYVLGRFAAEEIKKISEINSEISNNFVKKYLS
jgi:PTH1 family peptidyl-tRNA hydrolase